MVCSAQPTQSSITFDECGSGAHSPKKNSIDPRKSFRRYQSVTLAHPSSVSGTSSAGYCTRCARGGVRYGSHGETATRPSTRSGASAATSRAVQAELHSPTRTAESTPSSSITASVSATACALPYAAGSAGRSDRPLPRGSMVITRARRDSQGTWAFQARDSTIGSIGVNRTVCSPSPNTS